MPTARSPFELNGFNPDTREQRLETLLDPLHVSADVILTHPVGVNLTHLGNDGGFLATDNVDSGASSGDQGNGASRRQH